MAASLEITAIQNYAGKHAPAIVRSITEALTVMDDLYVIRDLTSPRNLWNFKANKGLRPLDISVENTSKLQGKFGERKITPELAMKFLKVVPEELRKTFLSEGLDPKARDFPPTFAQYFWQEQGKSIAEEINANVFDAVSSETVLDFNPATAYAVGDRVKFTLNSVDGTEYFRCVTITTAGQTPLTHPAKWENANAECIVKGLGTLIKKERTDGNLAGNVISTGAITNSNALDKIDVAMWDAIPDKVKNSPGGVTFYVSSNIYQKRVKALRALKGGGQFYTEEDIKELKPQIQDSDGKGKIKSCSWMNSSQLVIATVDKNLTMGVNQVADSSTFGPFIQGHHGYTTLMKMILAFQVQSLEALYVNDLN